MPQAGFELAIPASEQPQTIGVGNYPTDYLNKKTHEIWFFVRG